MRFILTGRLIADEILPFCASDFHTVNYDRLREQLGIWTNDRRYKPQILQSSWCTLLFKYAGRLYEFEWDDSREEWRTI